MKVRTARPGGRTIVHPQLRWIEQEGANDYMFLYEEGKPEILARLTFKRGRVDLHTPHRYRKQKWSLCQSFGKMGNAIRYAEAIYLSGYYYDIFREEKLEIMLNEQG